METANGLSFNCAESVLLRVNRELELMAFSKSCLQIASVFGGGVAGCGEICGAVSGAAMVLGLELGTNGTESPDEFDEKRRHARSLVKEFLNEFSQEWGSVRCASLVGMDKGEIAPEGNLRNSDYEIRNRCGEYVTWCSKKVIELLKEQPLVQTLYDKTQVQ